jgi:hypothetical protein
VVSADGRKNRGTKSETAGTTGHPREKRGSKNQELYIGDFFRSL